MANAKINALNLTGNARKAAEALAESCPDIVFTSGRRKLRDQARAMASNIVKQPDWVRKTYKPNKASKSCQEWVDDNIDKCKVKREVQTGLLEVLSELSKTDQQKISKHLGGLAFDIKPNSADLKTVQQTVKQFNGKFLDHEGRLCRWHAQFKN